MASILLSILNWKTQPLYDSKSNKMVLCLRSQDEDIDLNKYRCKVLKTPIKHSQFVTNVIQEETDVDQHGDIQVPLPCHKTFEFHKIGFNDMCNYFQNVMFYQDYDEYYQLPMPLLLNDSYDFYNDLTDQLANQEIVFSHFDDSNNINHPFKMNISRIDNLFKIAEYLQMDRLFTIIAARQATLIMNMEKNTMVIDWLMHKNNNKTRTTLITNVRMTERITMTTMK